MPRKKVGGRKIVTEDSDGNPVEMTIGSFVDLTVPQADDEMGVVPEYVNVSAKIQLITVPNQPDATLTVPKFGILRGAQWRNLSVQNRRWQHPPFMERELNGNGKFDKKYVLTEDQMIGELGALIRRKAVTELLNHSVMLGVEPDVPVGIPPEPLMRDQEDRPAVMNAAMKRMSEIQVMEEERRKALGIEHNDFA